MTKLATFGIKCGHCKERHLTAQEVRDCSNGVKSAPEPTRTPSRKRPTSARRPERKPTEKQMTYLEKLVAGKEMPEGARKAIREAMPSIDIQQASQIIRGLEALPWTPRQSDRPTRSRADDGMYRTSEGTIYRVQTAPGSDFRVAKRLVHEEGSKPHFEREDKMVYRLKPEERMTKEEAAKFGALYNFCIVCGRTLTHEDSIAAGIGPVCAEKV